MPTIQVREFSRPKHGITYGQWLRHSRPKKYSASAWDHPDLIPCDLNKKSWSENKFDAVLVGPGFGVNDFTAQVIKELKQKKIERVILDADALTVCAEKNFSPLLPTWIVTPHEGEIESVFERLG